MTDSRHSHWWRRAVSLSERAHQHRSRNTSQASVHASTTNAASGDNAAAVLPAPASEVRLRRWRTQRPFDRADVFVQRLRIDGLDEPTFEAILGDPQPTDDDKLDVPSWVSVVDRASEAALAVANARRQLGDEPDNPGDLAPVRAFVEPFVATGMRQLFASACSALATCPNAPFQANEATRLFEPTLWNRLLMRAARVIVLELNVARVQGTLVGDTPRARCANFTAQLRDGDLRQRIIDEYPVLARALAESVEFWHRAAAEFLEHLAADAAALRTAFVPTDASTGLWAELGVLTSLQAGAGDVHRHGRSVIVAEFSSGHRIVYKPRSLAVDQHFAQLVAWVNARGQSPPLRAVRTIDRGDHGWAEFIASTPCREPAEVGRFYERFGAQLALLHTLEATDFHFENVIADGEYPVLIDLEALFHPQPFSPASSTEPEWIGWTALQRSVLRTSVLPFRADAGEQGSIDLSALGGGMGQQSPDRHLVLSAAGTDEMHFVRDYVRLPDSRNRPALGATAVDPAAYADRVLSGFASMYQLLMRHRAELLAPDGPIHAFATDAVRIVLRPTRQYGLVLGESYHPDVLRDALERDRFIDRLWIAVPSRPELARAIAWEHADLVDGDVPLFTSSPASRDLFTAHGTRIEEFFERTGFDAAVEKIEAMSEHELARELWVIQASLVSLVPNGHESSSPASSAKPKGSRSAGTAPSSDECVEAAVTVGQRLTALALERGEQTAWLGLTLVRERDWTVQPIGPDLYGGALGIAFFLAYLADITGDAAAERLARRLVTQVMPRVNAAAEAIAPRAGMIPAGLGAFGILGGGVYAFAHFAALWNDEDLATAASDIVERAAAAVNHDPHLDVVSGVAGLLLAAVALESVRPAESTRTAIVVGANHLVARAEQRGSGIAWTTTVKARQPLTGLSHGASGIALALFAAGELLGDHRMTDSALAALRYERSTLDLDRANWPDYRILGENVVAEVPSFMWAWCHGAPGIGLARLAALALTAAPEIPGDLHIALGSTAASEFGANDSLCHGDLGNLELFVRAREAGLGGAWEYILASESANIVGRVRRGQWRCGVPAGVETPGLMLGLAGIGYQLLRLGLPRRVPSLLSLEPPRASSREETGR